MTDIQRRIYLVSQELFAARGYAGVSIADIATRARIAKSTVLHHYANKQKLYEQVVAESIDFFSRMPGAEKQSVSLAERLKYLLAQMVAEPMHAKLLNRVFMDNPKSAGMAARRYWRPLLKHLAGSDDPTTQATAMFCVNAIIQIAFSIELQREILGRCSAEEIAQRYSQVMDQLVAGTPTR